MRIPDLSAVILAAVFAWPAAAQEPAPVSLAVPEAAYATRSLQLSGSFVAQRSARLSPRLPGLVAQAPVDAGDQVSAGDTVLQLDTRLAELAVSQALAARQEAQARVTESQRLLDEAARLSRKQVAPETEIEARRAQVAVSEANLATAEASLAVQRERLERHAVPAPFDGVVAQRLVEMGEWVETGDAVVQLVGVGELWLDAQAPQEFLPAMSTDVRTLVRVDALGGQEFVARVHARVPVSDPTARTFLLRLVLDQPAPDIVPGMSATALLNWTSSDQVVYVPRDAIIRFPDGTTTVWIVKEAAGQATAHETEVAISRYEGDRAEIRSGLAADQPVVVRGNEVLSEGQPVRVVERQ
ncbi:MAG: efflux RND transporter periplasmic adaptor subunit [Xanthomonadales bacterium]|nr:efflux RND transporter periplasmic adaptor subunit [Xanthomonadales bacterium]